jgi:23S rRNA (uridine2552-2'-O)-methyltransferase
LSRNRWTHRQQNDPYVRRAHEQGWRARSAFKLMELDESDRIFHPSQLVVDLGAAPGGWCQVAVERVGKSGHVYALDILPMEPIEGVTFLQGDFRESEVLATFEEMLSTSANRGKVDVVLSDMAPNISGIAPSDQAKSMHLAELALDFGQHWLESDGCFVVKVFQGAGFDEFLTALRRSFKVVKVRKPKASRPESREVYLVAKGLQVNVS